MPIKDQKSQFLISAQCVFGFAFNLLVSAIQAFGLIALLFADCSVV